MIRLLSAVLISVVVALPAQALKVKDTEVADTLTLNNQELVLNGAGVRSKFFVNAYVAALYLPAADQDANRIVAADEPMAIRLYITSGMINAKRMSESTRDGFVRSTGGNTAPIEKEIETLISAFAEEVKEGDVFDMVYQPAAGVTVYRNGEAKAQVPGLQFKQALFGIWLSEDAIQSSLRKALVNS